MAREESGVQPVLDNPNHEKEKTFLESSFFLEGRMPTLPSPADVRAINEKSGDIRATSFNRPPPVTFPSLGLLVKYGADTTVAEAETQIMIYTHLKDRVPVPEVFGWTEDDGQVFIYMSLVEGETLEQRWGSLTAEERDSICVELSGMVTAWRSLEQDGQDRYIGSLNKQPLNEIFLSGHSDLAGPFIGTDAVKHFQNACDIEIDEEVAVVFTHADLVPSNILLSPGSSPRIAAILDWGQAGWYPAYWEFCKARRVRANPKFFSDDLEEEWNTKYLPMILESVDDETVYHPWLCATFSEDAVEHIYRDICVSQLDGVRSITGMKVGSQLDLRAMIKDR
ncbi:aminoglycoside phosphotransferase family protein [Aspergillus mulundensis]|uniref:Aminoglycoside phosphotransferase domain-containing protein n=1 Tax=Aspergillus mulundensis TaxID=1810919 RepID=A0A3D8T5I5_9EURO|nr:Uncharacterized protein DSM5745_01106 [Aspergillus mulundensis]RDW93784.1 Uncharacterized protein DSM5745_01106 [Aspergillus mulundensis]